MIHPFSAPCPKCEGTEGTKRHVPETPAKVYLEACQRSRELREEGRPVHRENIPLFHEEHLLRACKCEYVFRTRTADYVDQPASALIPQTP